MKHTAAVTASRKQEKMKEAAVVIKKELTVPTSNMSSRTRKKTSARDSRESSTAVGFVGAAFCLLPLCLIVLGDVWSLLRCVRMKLTNLEKSFAL